MYNSNFFNKQVILLIIRFLQRLFLFTSKKEHVHVNVLAWGGPCSEILTNNYGYITRATTRITVTRAIFFWERILKTIKQRNNNFIKNIFVFLLNNFIWTNKRGKTKLCFLPFGRNNFVHQENKNIIDKIVVSLF